MLRKKPILAVTIFIAIVMARPVFADLSFKARMKGGPVSFRASYYMKGNQVLIRLATGYQVIFALDTKTFTSIGPNGTCSAFSINSKQGRQLIDALRSSNMMMLRDSTVTPLHETVTRSGFRYKSYRVQLVRSGLHFDMVFTEITNPPPEVMRLKKVIGDRSPSWVTGWQGTINGLKMSYHVYDIDTSELRDSSLFDVVSICQKDQN